MLPTQESNFGVWLTLAIAATKQSGNAFAERHGYNRHNLQRYMSGQRIPKTALCRKLAKDTDSIYLDVLEEAGHVTRDERDEAFFDDLESGRFDEQILAYAEALLHPEAA